MSTTPAAPPTPTTPASINESVPTQDVVAPQPSKEAPEPSTDAPVSTEPVQEMEITSNTLESTTPPDPAPSNGPETSDIEMGEAHAHPSTTTPPPQNTEMNTTTNPETTTEPNRETNPPTEPQPPQTAPSPAPSSPNGAPQQPRTDPYTPISSLAYDPAFEDALMNYILDPSTLLPSSNSTSDSTLPVPLSIPPRSEAHTLHPLLALPLTHPSGSPYGGPGPLPLSSTPSNPSPSEPNPETLAFVSAFIAAHPRIKTEAGLRKAIEREVEERVRTAKERMAAREEAKRRNEGVEREVSELEAQRGMERRVWDRMRRGGGEG